MSWILGKTYLRRNKGLAEYRGMSYGKLVFHHPDIPAAFGEDCYMHHEDGRMMGELESCHPYDIITNESDSAPAICESVKVPIEI